MQQCFCAAPFAAASQWQREPGAHMQRAHASGESLVRQCNRKLHHSTLAAYKAEKRCVQSSVPQPATLISEPCPSPQYPSATARMLKKIWSACRCKTPLAITTYCLLRLTCASVRNGHTCSLNHTSIRCTPVTGPAACSGSFKVCCASKPAAWQMCHAALRSAAASAPPLTTACTRSSLCYRCGAPWSRQTQQHLV